MIPEAAVEAAARAIWDVDRTIGDAHYEQCADGTKDQLRLEARAALEAAEPFMRPDFRESNLKAILDELAKPLFPLGKIEDKRRHGND